MTDASSLAALAGKKTEDIFAALKTSEKGLSQAEASARLKIYGLNEFAGKKKLQPLLIFLSKFRNPLQILLIVAAIISGILDSHIEAIIILAIVFGSAFIDFFNTYKSARAAEALQEKVTITAAVMRGGELKERNMREVVPGDVFTLEAGDLVPADAIVIEAHDLFLNEGVLTGESLPVEKEPRGDGALAQVGFGDLALFAADCQDFEFNVLVAVGRLFNLNDVTGSDAILLTASADHRVHSNASINLPSIPGHRYERGPMEFLKTILCACTSSQIERSKADPAIPYAQKRARCQT